jgi:hypothetical protein
MRIRIVTIGDRGVGNQERLHLSVLAPANLVNYAVFDTVRIGNGLTIVPIPKNTFWFTDCEVRPGDQVVLYTRPGVPTKERRTDGHTNHFFFWNKPNTLWQDPNGCAVLIEINQWETSPV